MLALYYLQYQESKFDYIPPWYQEEKYMYTVCNKLSSLVEGLLTVWRYY